MKLLIKHPTRNRPEKFLKVLDKYIRLLDDKKTTEILVTCDTDDMSMNNDFIREVIGQYDNVKLCYGDSKTKMDAINADMNGIDFDIVLLSADDMVPIIKGYDTIIKNKMLEYYPDTDGVLSFNDGYQGSKLNTLPIIGKKYYDRFGYIYYPGYFSVWCDNELTDIANMLNKQTYFEDVIIRHEHPDWGYGKRDIVHELNFKNEQHDRELYNNRKSKNFFL